MKLLLLSMSIWCVALEGMRTPHGRVRAAAMRTPMRAYHTMSKNNEPLKVVCKPNMVQQMNIALQSMNDSQRAEARNLYAHVQFHAIEGTLDTAAASLATLDSIERSLVLDQVDENGRTLLIKAASIGYIDFMKFLLDRGAYAGVADNNNLTALSINPTKLTELITYHLLENGAGVSRSDKWRRQALHYLAQRRAADCTILADSAWHDGHIYEGINGKVARMLVRRGANMYARDIHDRTPVCYAVDTNHIEVLKAFIDCGVDRLDIIERANGPVKEDLLAHYKIY